MKFIARVSLFLFLGLAVFMAGAYVNSMYLNWFYPNTDKNNDFVPYEAGGEGTGEELSLPVSQGQEEVVTCDTSFSIEEYDLVTDTSVTHEELVPGKYLGMDREQFMEAMGFYELSPPLTEQERGFVSLEVLSFSRDKISLRKNYRVEQTEEDTIFYLVCENNYITVYKNDMMTVYMYTDISVEGLPEELQEEIIQKKLVTGEGELYNFLESYSS